MGTNTRRHTLVECLHRKVNATKFAIIAPGFGMSYSTSSYKCDGQIMEPENYCYIQLLLWCFESFHIKV